LIVSWPAYILLRHAVVKGFVVPFQGDWRLLWAITMHGQTYLLDMLASANCNSDPVDSRPRITLILCLLEMSGIKERHLMTDPLTPKDTRRTCSSLGTGSAHVFHRPQGTEQKDVQQDCCFPRWRSRAKSYEEESGESSPFSVSGQ
jgi:hypothetical protein